MENNVEQKQKRVRSAAYPNYPLNVVIEFTTILRNALGKGPYSRDTAAIALGYKGISGISATKISAMVHFGLLERTGNGSYSQSELAERIIHPISDEDKNNATAEAVSKPKLYKSLLKDFMGQGLPTQLGNLLIRKGISSKISNDVADNFRKSLEFAGYLKNGVVSGTPASSNETNEQMSNRETVTDPDPAAVPLVASTTQQYVFNDSGNGWTLTIKSTRSLSSAIKKQLVDIAESLEGDNTPNT